MSSSGLSKGMSGVYQDLIAQRFENSVTETDWFTDFNTETK